MDAAAIPQQTDTQRQAAFDAAGLNKDEQANVTAGRYSRIPTADVPAVPSYNSVYDTNRSAEINRQQDAFNAIEKNFNSELTTSLAREDDLGKQDVARSNTISAMTGNVGNPEAATREGNANVRTNDRKNAVTADVTARKSAALSALYGRIDQNAADAAKIDLQTKRDDQAKLQDTTAKNALNNVLSFAGDHGVNWSTFSKAYNSDKTLQDEVARSGKTMPELYQLYTSTLPVPPKTDYAWRGDSLVAIETDPTSGKTTTHSFSAKDLGIPKGTDFQTVTLGKNVYWVDKNDPFNQDGSPKMSLMGASPKTAADDLSSTLLTPLLGAGFSKAESQQIDNDVKTHGLEKTVAGMSKPQADAVRKIYKGDVDNTDLSRENLSKFFGIADDEGKSGWFGTGNTNKEKLDAIVSTVEKYRAVGYKDSEILKMMQTQK